MISAAEQHRCSSWAFISSPLHPNLSYFGGADQKHSHDQAMRAPSTWINPFLIASRPNSTTQTVAELTPWRAPAQSSLTAWPLTYAVLLTNFWHSMLQMGFFLVFFNNETSLDLIPDVSFSTAPQTSVYSTSTEWEAKNCFKFNWPQNTHTLKTQLMSLTEASISIPKIDVCSSQEADF